MGIYRGRRCATAFLYAQSRGWTNWLPAAFHMFTSSAWGGTASVVSVLRYGGMFGDYELLAEFLDMVVLLCVGVLMAASSGKERFFASCLWRSY